MNYKLSTYADRVTGKRGFVLERSGKNISDLVEKFEDSNIKENALIIITKGLRASKSFLKHNDLIIVEVQNTHLCEWLNGMKESKGYDELLATTFEVIEGMDCKYRFHFNKKPYAKGYINSKDFTTIKYGSVDDMMSEFE